MSVFSLAIVRASCFTVMVAFPSCMNAVITVCVKREPLTEPVGLFSVTFYLFLFLAVFISTLKYLFVINIKKVICSRMEANIIFLESRITYF